MITRRKALLAGTGLSLLPACVTSSETTSLKRFPDQFLWGASVAGHQVEGNNVNSDIWYLENLPDSAFKDRSGDAVNHLELWETDLDIAKAMGLNTFRFSVEWARIEPVEGSFSTDGLAHYRKVMEGCKARGLNVFVTYNHFASPLWLSADGGWLNEEAPERFARYCEVVSQELGDLMDYAITFNEPQILPLLRRLGLPNFVIQKQEAMLATAEADLGIERFSSINVSRFEDIDRLQAMLVKGHISARDVIKSIQPDLPLGVSIAIFDDQEAEPDSVIDQVREELYAPWLAVAKDDDFLGIQNYERAIWNKSGKQDPPEEDVRARNFMGHEVYPPSIAGAVRYGHEMTGRPIIVTEHGVGTDDDAVRAEFIEQSLAHLHAAMEDDVPVLGYCHWSLLDNFEWIFGFGPKFGLIDVDRATFERTPKPSAAIYGRIAKANALSLIWSWGFDQ